LVESELSRPCAKGTSAHRSRRLGWFDKWELSDPTALAPAECDRLRRTELYDVTADPNELRDVASDHAEIVQQLRHQLPGAVARNQQAQPITLSPADRDRLHALGYRTGEEPSGESDQ
jgi:hypothetical protein